MADPVLRDFYGRVSRIEYASRRGMGFEAAGTMGRSHHARRRGLRIPVLGPVLVLVLGVTALKATIHNSIGAANYEQRVERLWQAEGVERFGAFLMQPDPITLYISAQLNRALR